MATRERTEVVAPTGARVVGALMAAALWAMGLHAVVTRYSVGRTRAGTLVVLDGASAMWMGGVLCALGTLPLTLVVRTARARGWVIAAAVVGVVGCLVMSIVSR